MIKYPPMKILAIDRSTDTQSVALAMDGSVTGRVFAGMDSRSAEWPVKIREFLAARGLSVGDLDQVLVGQGPGSFAGIRAALAFAQGIALGSGEGRAKVVGLPSTYALTRDGARTAVVGDARRDRFWVVVYDGVTLVKDFTLVTRDGLAGAVPEHWAVVTPDGARIEHLLQGVFGHHYKGSLVPLAQRLAEVAVAHPDLPRPEPLPIYLQPAVRPPEGAAANDPGEKKGAV